MEKKILKRKLEHSDDSHIRKAEKFPEIALAAIMPSNRTETVDLLIKFILKSLENNSEWLNEAMEFQEDVKCYLMVGAGPNRFQTHEKIYPTDENGVKFEVELKESEDYDKIAIAVVMQMSNYRISKMLDYINLRLHENLTLKEDLFKGKELGINFALLKPISDTKYRIAQRLPASELKLAALEKKAIEEKLRAYVNKRMKRVAAKH